MTNQLTTNPKTHIVIFHDRSEKSITQREADALFQAREDFVRVDGQVINLKSVSKVLTISEYYQQYPEKRPPQTSRSNGGYSEEVAKYKGEVDDFIAQIKEELKKPDARQIIHWDGGHCLMTRWEMNILKRQQIINDRGIIQGGRYYIFQLARNEFSRQLERQEWARKQNQPPTDEYEKDPQAKQINYNRVKEL